MKHHHKRQKFYPRRLFLFASLVSNRGSLQDLDMQAISGDGHAQEISCGCKGACANSLKVIVCMDLLAPTREIKVGGPCRIGS